MIHPDSTKDISADHTLPGDHFLVDVLPHIVWTARPDGRLEYCSQHWYDYTGMTLEQTWTAGWGPALHPDDLPEYVDRWSRAIRDREDWEVEFRLQQGSGGACRWHVCRARPQRNEEGEIVRWVGTCTDIHDHKHAVLELQQAHSYLQRQVQERARDLVSINERLLAEITERQRAEEVLQESQYVLETKQAELAEANAKLEALATTDGLTGLKNHRTFQESLEQEFYRARRYGTPLSIVLLDVDRFKQYNDTFGHPAGDQILKQMARVLQEQARSTDMVARYGGEEFVLVLSNTDESGARQTAERLRAAAEAALWPGRTVTASFGVSTYTAGTANAAALVDQADKALYHSKRRGRNCVTHFDAIADADGVHDAAANPDMDGIQALVEMLMDQPTSAADNRISSAA